MDSVGSAIVDEARTWIGTPYRHQACVKGVGCDCYGLVYGVALTVPGLWRPPRVSRYSNVPSREMARICHRDMDAIALDDVQLGDVVFIRFSSHPQHLAIYAGGTVVHAMSGVGFVAEHRYSGYWRSLTVAAFRLRRA